MSYRECDPNVIKKQIGFWSWASLGVKTSLILKESDGEGGAYPCGLQLVLKRGRFIEVRLQADDTYEVTYVRMIQQGARRGQVVTMATYEGIYADQLAELVEERHLMRVEETHKARQAA